MGGHGLNQASPTWWRDPRILLFLAAHLPFVALNTSHFLTDTLVLTSVGALPGLWSIYEWAKALRANTKSRDVAAIFLAAAISYVCGVTSYGALDLAGVTLKYPSPADFFFLLTPIFLVVGLFRIHPQGERPGFQFLQAADLILVASATTIFAVVSIAPALARYSKGLLYEATTLAYWVVSFAAAGFALLALLSFQWRERRTVIILLTVTLAVFTLGVIPYTYDLMVGGYVAGVWYELFWYTTPCFLALAGRVFRAAEHSAELSAPSRRLRLPRALPTLVVAGTIFMLGLIIAQSLGAAAGAFVAAASFLAAVAVGMRESIIKSIEDDLEGRLQEALDYARDNEIRFKHFAQSSSDFFVETDANLAVMRVMAGNEASPDVAPEWLIGQSLFSHYFGEIDYRDPPITEVERALSAHLPFKDFQYRFRRSDDSSCWRRYSGTPFFDSAGGFLGYRIAIRDITAQKELQHRNERGAAELARVVQALDSVSEAIVILDKNDRITYANVASDSLRGACGATRGELFNEAFPNLLAQHPRLLDEIKEDFGRLGAWSSELVITFADQREAFFDVRAAALPDGGMILAASEVTERKHRERSERILTQKLAEAQKNEAIGKLAGSIAHDFNNIIAAIRSFASLIVYDLPSDHKDHAFAQRIVGASDRAAELVRQILLFARAASAEKEPIALKAVLDELRHTVVPTLTQGTCFSLVTPESEAVVEGNSAQLLQIFMNLCLNAADAAGPDGSVKVVCDQVAFAPSQVEGMILGWSEYAGPAGGMIGRYISNAPLPGMAYHQITVADNGGGIPDGIRSRLFEPFFTTKEKKRGTGLGLPVVKSIADAHNAIIVIETSEKVGTQFRVIFPASRDEVRQPSVELRDIKGIKGKGSVLVVDDEVDVADGLAFALQRYGYEAASVYGPEEALAAVSEDPQAWNVVITDQVMPNIKGVQLTRKLKRLNHGIDVILCTGFSDNVTEQKALEAGASAFFNKPVASDVIAETIRRLRNRRR